MDAKTLSPGIRKAAVLFRSLDRQTAEALLGRMDPGEAEQVRRAASQLAAVDHDEQEGVVAEFRRLGSPGPRDAGGVELDRDLARRLAGAAAVASSDERRLGHRFALPQPPDALPQPPDALPQPAEPPFRFLRQAELDKLARILATERAQVIALVLSHLPAPGAGKVLARLAPAVQVDVVRRLAELEETDPETLREVERGLQRRLSEQLQMQRRRVAGVDAVRAILHAMEPPAGMQILEHLAQQDRGLMERLSPGRLDFDGLMELDDHTLGTTVGAADPELVLLALIGAPPQWLDRFLAHVPEGEAKAIRYRLDHFGPVRLSDVDEARRRLADLANGLALEGRIELPRRAEGR